MCERFNEVRERAKLAVRSYSNQQRRMKERWKSGEITRDDWLTWHKEYEIRIKTIQNLFEGV